MNRQTEGPVLPVLVVEDNPTRRESLCATLESCGYPVFADSSESDLSRRISEWKIAGIVVGAIDIDLRAWLRKNRPDLDQRTVFVKKPFRPEQLLSAVRKSVCKPPKTERILVVDDEEPIREIMSLMLSVSGYRCRPVPNGVKALELLDSGERFDLVTSDICNDPMDGLTFLERLRHKYPDIPLLMISAVHGISLTLECLRNGAYDYLMKPFEHDQLLFAVRRALDHRHLKLENRKLRSQLEKLKRR